MWHEKAPRADARDVSTAKSADECPGTRRARLTRGRSGETVDRRSARRDADLDHPVDDARRVRARRLLWDRAAFAAVEVEAPAVPRARDLTAVDDTLGERGAAVRAGVVDRV